MQPISWKEFVKKKEEKFKNNQKVWMQDIGRKGRVCFKREAWTFLPQSDLPEKVFLIERLRTESFEGKIVYKDDTVGRIIYRMGYFIVSPNGTRKGRWVWGQFCPVFPTGDLDELIRKAKKEGTILND